MENQSYKIPNVPPLVQHPDLPTGCEATALAMLLNWAGLEISKYAVVDALPKGDKVHTVGGERIGANPHYEFVGDPYVEDRKSTRLNSSHVSISYAVFCLKKK